MEKDDKEKGNHSKDDMSTEVKKSFLNQFAANQNHHQALFIQFLSSVIVVLAVYAFVYTNTYKHKDSEDNSAEEAKNYITSSSDSSCHAITLSGLKFQTLKNKEGYILSYGVIHLISIYLFAQMVLIILGTILLHLGYAYRRDQNIIIKIRKMSLEHNEYKDIFGTNFTPLNKKFYNYLPDFYRILFFAIIIIVVILYISIFIYFGNNNDNAVFISNILGYAVTYGKLKFILSVPFLFLIFFFLHYFIKYNKRVNNTKFHDQLSITEKLSSDKLKAVSGICLFLAVCKFSVYAYSSSFMLLAAGIINVSVAVVSYAFAFIGRRKNENATLKEAHLNNQNSIVIKNILSIIIYLTCLVLSLIAPVFDLINKSHSHIVHIQITILLSFFITSATYLIAQFNQKKHFQVKNNLFFSFDQLKLDSYLSFVITVNLIIIFYSKINMIDTIVACAFGFLVLTWVVQNVLSLTDYVFGRH